MKNNKLNTMKGKRKKISLRQRLGNRGYIVTNDTIFDRNLIVDTDGNRHGYMSVEMGWKFLRKIIKEHNKLKA